MTCRCRQPELAHARTHARNALPTHQGKHLLVGVHLVVEQLDDAVDARQPPQQVDLALVAAHRDLVGAVQRHALERKHVAVLGRDAVHLGAAAAAEAVEPGVAFAVDAEHVAPLLGLRRRRRRGARRRRSRLEDRHLGRRRRRPARRVVRERRQRLPLGRAVPRRRAAQPPPGRLLGRRLGPPGAGGAEDLVLMVEGRGPVGAPGRARASVARGQVGVGGVPPLGGAGGADGAARVEAGVVGGVVGEGDVGLVAGRRGVGLGVVVDIVALAPPAAARGPAEEAAGDLADALDAHRALQVGVVVVGAAPGRGEARDAGAGRAAGDRPGRLGAVRISVDGGGAVPTGRGAGRGRGRAEAAAATGRRAGDDAHDALRPRRRVDVGPLVVARRGPGVGRRVAGAGAAGRA